VRWFVPEVSVSNKGMKMNKDGANLGVFCVVLFIAIVVGIMCLIQMHKESNDPLAIKLHQLQQENATSLANRSPEQIRHDADTDNNVAILRSMIQQYQRDHDIGNFDDAKRQYEHDPEHPLKNDFIMYIMKHKK